LLPRWARPQCPPTVLYDSEPEPRLLLSNTWQNLPHSRTRSPPALCSLFQMYVLVLCSAQRKRILTVLSAMTYVLHVTAMSG
jgi:hypothetical protein